MYHKSISYFIFYFKDAFEKLISDFKGYKQKGNPSYYERKLPHNGCLKFNEVTFDYAELFVRSMYFPPHDGAYFEDIDGNRFEVKSTKELIKYRDNFKK